MVMTGREPFSADYPFASHFIEVNGARMHYIDEGSGKPFVFLHGNSTWSYLWRNVLPHVTSRGRCIAPDLIGFGKSDKPDISYRYFDHYTYIEQFIEKLELDDITFILHDWGGGIGFDYAMRHPERVRGLAFMETFVRTFDTWDDWPPDLVEAFKQFRTPEIGWDLIVNQNVFMKQIFTHGINRTMSDEEIDAYMEPFQDVAHRKPLWVWPQELPIDGKPKDVAEIVQNYVAKLKLSTLPKLLFHVQPGAIIPPETVDMCRQSFPNLEDVFLGKSGHYVPEDFPHEIGEKIVEWSDGIGP